MMLIATGGAYTQIPIPGKKSWKEMAKAMKKIFSKCHENSPRKLSEPFSYGSKILSTDKKVR